MVIFFTWCVPIVQSSYVFILLCCCFIDQADTNIATSSPVNEESNENGLQKNQVARDSIISELYQTEVDYCTCLELCVATFHGPGSSPLPSEDRETLFGNINSVVNLSRLLINRLKADVMQKPSAEQIVGMSFGPC